MKFATMMLLAAPAMCQEATMTTDETTSEKQAKVSTFTFDDENGTYSQSTYFNPNDNSTRKEMRRTFDDYFTYAYEGHLVPDDEAAVVPQCTLDTECGDGGAVSKCCVRSVLKHKVDNTNEVYYRCMTKSVAEANINMSIGPIEANMKCVGSGAQKLIAGVTSLTLAALTLY